MSLEDLTTPINIESEQAALGSCLIDAAVIPVVASHVKPHDFYRPAHEIIMRAILNLHKKQAPIDLISMTTELRAMGELDNMGGTEYLFALVETVPTAHQAEYYARLVKRTAILRRQQQFAVQMKELTAKPDADPLIISEAMMEQIAESGIAITPDLYLVGELTDAHYSVLEDRASKDTKKLFSSGLSTFDKQFGKLGDTHFIVLKGRRGSGKTHWAINWVVRCAQFGRTAVLYSMEMGKYQVMDRLISRVAGFNASILRSMSAKNAYTLAAKGESMLMQLPIAISDKTNMSINEIRLSLKSLLHRNHDIGFVAIDYAELVGAPKGCTSREQELSRIASGLKDVSNEIGCTVLLLSQTNKEGGERYSEALGNAADLLLLWDAKERTLVSEKNRFGTAFTVYANCDLSNSTFRERERVHTVDY